MQKKEKEMRKAIFWDFDGTLVQSPSLWSNAFLQALKGAWPGCPLSLEDVRPHLRSGFPWHTPEKDFTGLTGERWWEHMVCHFEKAGLALGATQEIASKAARAVREIIVSPENYALYEDTLQVLDRLKALGFSQYIVSNNYPELFRIAAALGLAPYFSGMVVSGEIGYDKPRPEIFEAALELAGHPGCCFFIGDNPVADGQGAADAGIPVLLVHIRENPRGFTAFETLTQVLHCVEGKI